MSWTYHFAADGQADLRRLPAKVQEALLDELETLLERADAGEIWTLTPQSILLVVDGEAIAIKLELLANESAARLIIVGVEQH